MPGIAILKLLDTNKNLNLKEQKERFESIYVMPGLGYNKYSYVNETSVSINIYPLFIKDIRLKRIDNFVIIMDGDFYNEIEIASDLGISTQDKLLILKELYLKYGRNFPIHLNGEFVIVINDLIKHELIIVNDRFARRPSFYYNDGSTFAIASEKKAFMTIPNFSKGLDLLGLSELFVFRHNINQRTFLNNVKYLKPATTLVVSKSGVDYQLYYKWKFRSSQRFEKIKFEEEIYHKLRDAVNKRISGKKRLLLWISGGFDSRSIACSIDPKYKSNILAETFGEKGSSELSIAKRVAKVLNFKWEVRHIEMSYHNVAKIGSWRSEFSISALEHPLPSYHSRMKANSDYIISGLPGADVLGAVNISLNVLIHSLQPNFKKFLFQRYTQNLLALELFFTKDFIGTFSKRLEESFYEAIDSSGTSNLLTDWELFNILNRQPHYSNISDHVENDLFETIHPYADVELVNLFTQIPFRYRIFQQLPKNMLYRYYPKLRDIEYSSGRGKLAKNNSSINYMYKFIKKNFRRSKDHSQNWNRTLAIKKDYDILKSDYNEFFNDNPQIKDILDKNKLDKIFSSPENLSAIPFQIDMLFTFMYTYKYFFCENLSIPTIVKDHFGRIS